ncbi:MAG TPA: DUF885 domain-containing protein, partial [Myxococcales bacterium]|nr:DUF885 domain-containing protein [Myxococcales bacterium]
MRIFALVPAVALFAACGPPPEQPPELPTPDELRAELGGLPFDEFVDRSFQELLRRSPEAVVELGLQSSIDVGHGFLGDASDEFDQQTGAVVEVIADVLQAHDRAALSRDQQITFDVYAWYLDDQVQQRRHADLQYPLSPSLTSVDQSTQLFFTDLHPLRSAAEVEDWLARLGKVQAKYRQVKASFERRARAGIVLPRLLLDITRDRLEAMASAAPRDTPFYAAFQARLEAVDGVDRRQALDRAEQVLRDSVIPAYAELDQALGAVQGLAPAGLGVGQLPGGSAFYLDALRHHVTTAATPDELDALGTADLASIHSELDGQFAALGYPSTGTLAESMARAGQESGLVPADQVVAAYEAIIDDAWGRLDQAFDLKPSSEVIVVGVPSGGYYVEASLDGSRPGAFYATAGGAGEQRLGMRTLAYHEAVPGHHLQIGVAEDLALPLFRKVITFTGYVEGWALYSEWMTGDLGWYAGDPYGAVGRLQSQAFRAERLVVDTGIHARGWTFDQAVQS